MKFLPFPLSLLRKMRVAQSAAKGEKARGKNQGNAAPHAQTMLLDLEFRILAGP